MKKKIIIISIIGILLLGLAIFLYFSSRQKTNVAEQPPIPKPAFLPNDTSTSYLPISNSSNDQEINNTLKKITEEPISTDEKNKGIKWTRFGVDSSHIILLDDFSRASGLKINTDVKSILNGRSYEVFNCPNNAGGKDFGLTLYFKVLGSFSDSSLDLKKWLAEWESTMFTDTHTIIFPNMNFTNADLKQDIKFKDGKYRYAEIILPDGSKGSLNYSMIGGNAIVISSSVKCLDAAAASIAPVEP